jgi:hypothetical protein
MRLGAAKTARARSTHCESPMNAGAAFRSSVGINRGDAAPTPTGFAEPVCDKFPVFQLYVERGSFA